MKISEIRELNAEEIAAKINDLKEEHFNLRFQHSIGQLENTGLLPNIKRDIARLETVKRELELNKNTDK
jgi:large subunit ribosomal protein L29